MSSTPPAGIGLKAVGLERRLTVGFGLYVVALFSVVAVLGGSVVAAVFMIGLAEIMLSFWRPTPRLGEAAYKGPAGSAWQDPITVMRWYVVARTGIGLATGALLVTAFFAFFIFFAMKPTGLGRGSYAVIALFGVWLASRWFWAPSLVRWVGGLLGGLGRPRIPTVQVGVDGLNVVAATYAIDGVPRLIQVFYSEIDEMRTLDWLDAQAYWQSMAQYDPSLGARGSWELLQFLRGQIQRPSILMNYGQGLNLLIRGPQLLYMVGWVDTTGPNAVAAWQAWRAAHVQQPAAPTA